jgi:hypothetical protein
VAVPILSEVSRLVLVALVALLAPSGGVASSTLSRTVVGNVVAGSARSRVAVRW